ncbi:hypothetical protein ACFL1H_07390, partial [Nanoarchaeota archaeon]
MNSKQKYLIGILLIFLIVLGLRLYFAFQTPHFDKDAYFNVKQIENIKNTGLPLFSDPLSYGGRGHIFIPGFHYIMSIFTFFLPITIVLKILPNIFASLLVIILYHLIFEITKNRKVGLIGCIMGGFVPIFFAQTFNSVSVYSISIPLMFLTLYFMILLNKDNKYSIPLTLSFMALIFTDPAAILIVIVLLLYFVLAKS